LPFPIQKLYCYRQWIASVLDSISNHPCSSNLNEKFEVPVFNHFQAVVAKNAMMPLWSSRESDGVINNLYCLILKRGENAWLWNRVDSGKKFKWVRWGCICIITRTEAQATRC
jgi:hypothetical protein